MLPGDDVRVKGARSRASKRGLEANLTIDDWIQTCLDMDYCCAYCKGKVSGTASLDHFQPLALKGGTTITNCILSCVRCNHSKGSLSPEIFLCGRPERLARIKAYLSNRRPGQVKQAFWTFSLLKGYRMNKDEMQSTPHKLNSGTELCIYNDAQNTVLQFRQSVAEDDPLVTSVQVATQLTPSECLALAGTLLTYAVLKVEDKQPPVAPEFSSSTSKW